MATRASASLIRCFSLVISSNVDIPHLRGRVLVDPDRSIFWVSRLLGTLRFPLFPRPSDTKPPAIFSPLRCIVEVEVSFPLDRSVTGSATNPIAFVGRLGRAYSRPFLDLFLFAQKTVDFGSTVLTRSSCLSATASLCSTKRSIRDR